MFTADEVLALAKQIEDLAFQIPPANAVTPQLAMIALFMRGNALKDLALAYQHEREMGKALEAQQLPAP